MTESKDSQLKTEVSPFKKWRRITSNIVFVLIFGFILWWGWNNHELLIQIFIGLGFYRLAGIILLFIGSIILTIFTFTILIRGMGYAFSFIDGYHCLNLAQVAAVIPGKVWGFAGLTGLLWARGISKKDSVLIIFLNTLIMLSACVIVGLIGLVPVIGWGFALLCLAPILIIMTGRPWLEKLRQRYFKGTSELPSFIVLFKILLAGIFSWILVAITFAWIVHTVNGGWPTSPFLVASAWPAGYVGGFISLIAPSGLGVSEGIVTLILGPSMGHDQALGAAIAYRVIHTFVLWANVAVSLVMLSLSEKESITNTKKPE